MVRAHTMALVVNVSFTPVDSNEYRLFLYVNGVVGGVPAQPVLLDSKTGQAQARIDVPRGATLFGVAAFQKDLSESGRPGYVHAGTALVPISDLTQPQSLPVAIHHNNNLLNGLVKGQFTIRGLSVPSVPRSAFSRPALRDNLVARMSQAITQVYAPLDVYPGAFPMAKRLKATFWYTPNGPMPFPLFQSRYNVVPPTENALKNVAVIAAERHGLTLTSLGVLLQGVVQGRSNVKLAGKVLASMLTAYVNSLPYLTDYGMVGNREVITEWFDRVKNRNSGDCEDFARDICLTFRFLVAGKNTFSNPVLRLLALFASGYVCAMMLGTVTQPSAGNSVSDHEDQNAYAGHMFAMLFSREQWGAWQGLVVDPSPWTLAYPYPFVLEGTGYMSPVVREADEERMYRSSINRAIKAFPKLRNFQHEIVSPTLYHVSPFYRQLTMGYATPLDYDLSLNDPYNDWVEEFGWIDASGRHGITYDDLVLKPEGIRLIKMNAFDQDVKDMGLLALSTMAPERASRVDVPPDAPETLLGAYTTSSSQKGNPVHFYIPIEPGVDMDVATVSSYFGQVFSTRNPIVSAASFRVENFDFDNRQIRVTVWVNN